MIVDRERETAGAADAVDVVRLEPEWETAAATEAVEDGRAAPGEEHPHRTRMAPGTTAQRNRIIRR